MSVRWRLALLACVLSGAMIIATFLALFFAVRNTLTGTLDASLRGAVSRRVDDVLRRDRPRGPVVIQRHLNPPITRLVPARPLPPDAALLVTFDPSGKVLAGTPPLRLPLREGFTRTGGYRVLTVRLPDGTWIRGYRSEAELLRSLEGVTRIFWIVAPAVLLLGLLGGYFLADRALRPVDAVTRLAGRIAASGRYAERVPLSPGRDEMARLTGTINAMLDRLGSLIERERAFALAAAHELRTPLAVIRARASLALERERDPAQYQDALREVRDVSDELAHLADRLMALARAGGPARREAVDLADVALEVSELHLMAATEREMRLEPDLGSAPTLGDGTALTLAASNLLQNAVRYGRRGGHIRICTRLEGAVAVLRVEDDGPGIPAADRERLLQPFQRGLGLQGSEGAGLGLALASAVAEQHGGQLRLDKATTGGLSAELQLPAVSEPEAETRSLASRANA
ncbi:signal transduction histidine kinase [Deinobacterium chartae]|uniref:histidine kinase n=1 Tax=Deinobacterium chartae TaxID=521158 RepID=A0A841I396_9DEIO|nr:HAMP domain-containing sensor histidine kinase [Deinobacterium chartae]MBB6100137.1 signal transduction histidine kinase [Deinobacterium chartae]